MIPLHTSILAFSCGTGDGSFLFQVFGGVRTGFPLSALLFLLCINPFVHLFHMLSDVLKLSVTRVCADDFGSALKALKTLKIHASIFRLAVSVAGLHLKPSKCILIVSAFSLDEFLISAIRNWLAEHVPDFAVFNIASSGKYLGWYLGVDDVSNSFKGPVQKFGSRIEEIKSASAPAAVSFCRYNQRAIPVLSYVAQFAVPPQDFKFSSMYARGIHSMLRMPPNSMTWKLCRNISFCFVVEPIPIDVYCAACLSRFAQSEREYLLQLWQMIEHRVMDILPLTELGGYQLPFGSISSPPILQSLLGALDFQGVLSLIPAVCRNNDAHSWILDFPVTPMPSRKGGIQSAVLEILKEGYTAVDLPLLVAQKAVVTLGNEYACGINMQINWFHDLRAVLQQCGMFLRMCWLKAICGLDHHLQNASGYCVALHLWVYRF